MPGKNNDFIRIIDDGFKNGQNSVAYRYLAYKQDILANQARKQLQEYHNLHEGSTFLVWIISGIRQIQNTVSFSAVITIPSRLEAVKSRFISITSIQPHILIKGNEQQMAHEDISKAIEHALMAAVQLEYTYQDAQPILEPNAYRTNALSHIESQPRSIHRELNAYRIAVQTEAQKTLSTSQSFNTNQGSESRTWATASQSSSSSASSSVKKKGEFSFGSAASSAFSPQPATGASPGALGKDPDEPPLKREMTSPTPPSTSFAPSAAPAKQPTVSKSFSFRPQPKSAATQSTQSLFDDSPTDEPRKTAPPVSSATSTNTNAGSRSSSSAPLFTVGDDDDDDDDVVPRGKSNTKGSKNSKATSASRKTPGVSAKAQLVIDSDSGDMSDDDDDVDPFMEEQKMLEEKLEEQEKLQVGDNDDPLHRSYGVIHASADSAPSQGGRLNKSTPGPSLAAAASRSAPVLKHSVLLDSANGKYYRLVTTQKEVTEVDDEGFESTTIQSVDEKQYIDEKEAMQVIAAEKERHMDAVRSFEAAQATINVKGEQAKPVGEKATTAGAKKRRSRASETTTDASSEKTTTASNAKQPAKAKEPSGNVGILKFFKKQ